MSRWVCKTGLGWAQLGPGLPVKGPTWPRCLGYNWSARWRQLFMLGWSWTQSDPDALQVEAVWCTWSKSVLTCRNLAPLVTASQRVGPNGDTTWGASLIATKTWKIHDMKILRSESGRLEDFGLGRSCPPFWSHMDTNLGRICSQMAAILEPSPAEVGANWCWGVAGRSWPQVGPMLWQGRIETKHLDDFVPICKMCKLSPSLLSKMPPSWSCTTLTDLSGRIHC